MGRFEGKKALITGGARGIGLAVAKILTREGALVAVCDINEEMAKTSAQELKKLGAEGVPYLMDVSNRESADRVIADFVERESRLDILINNAGITRDSLLLRMTDAQWDEVLRINLTSMFYCTRAALKPMMKQRYGKIVNLSSVSAVMGNPGQANYAASKGGVIAFTKTVAKEMASRNITVNAVAPGFIKTALTDLMTEKARAAVVNLIPLKRFGQPEDVAQAIVFLVSEEASYITGQILQIDGGLAM